MRLEEVGGDDTASAASPKTLEPLPRTRRSCQAPLQESAGNPRFLERPVDWDQTESRVQASWASTPGAGGHDEGSEKGLPDT